MVNSSTSWTVRTSKRKSPASGPNPRKRRRSVEDIDYGHTLVRRTPRQQTLTQIQFIAHGSQDDGALDLEPTATVPRRAQAQQNVGRLQKRNSTLTQMDFLASSAIHIDEEDDLTPYKDAGDVEIGDIEDKEALLGQLDGSRDTPNPRRKNGAWLTEKTTFKRKGTPVVSQESEEFKPTYKKRKMDGAQAADGLEHGRRTSSRAASAKATRSIGLLSTRYGGDKVDSVESPSAKTIAAAPRAQILPALLQEPSWPFSDQENQPLSQRRASKAFMSTTPSKRKSFVPSSQSPETSQPSTRRTTSTGANAHIPLHERSPLRERSVNAQLGRQRRAHKDLSSKRLQGPSPPKRKICVLKLPRHKPQQEQVPVENSKTLSENSVWSLPTSSPAIEASEKRPFTQMLEVKDSSADSEPKEPVRAPTLEIQNSVEEDELEIAGTGQVDCQRVLVSSPRAAETQETLPSLRGLLGLRDGPEEMVTLQETNHQDQAGRSGIVVKDFAMYNGQRQAPQSYTTGMGQDEQSFVEGPGLEFVADSEEEEGSILAFSPGSSIANDTQFNVELAERLPASSEDASPSPLATRSHGRSFSSSLQLGHEIQLSVPHPHLVHKASTHSMTRTVPLNDTSSSPSLPSRSTQHTVYPASLPRLSQISTQDPTQPYLPMSSMPLAPLSSPTRSGQATITIKDSSSVPRPLRDIPLQKHSHSVSQSQLNVDLGIDDCLDAEEEDEDDDLDEGLAALSDKVEGAINEQEESQIVPLPLYMTYSRDKSEARSKSTEQGSPMRRRRPRKPIIPPEVRALLGETFLESVPGPPGWSQRSWDDEPL